jgi:hypothetical protein
MGLGSFSVDLAVDVLDDSTGMHQGSSLTSNVVLSLRNQQ